MSYWVASLIDLSYVCELLSRRHSSPLPPPKPAALAGHTEPQRAALQLAHIRELSRLTGALLQQTLPFSVGRHAGGRELLCGTQSWGNVWGGSEAAESKALLLTRALQAHVRQISRALPGQGLPGAILSAGAGFGPTHGFCAWLKGKAERPLCHWKTDRCLSLFKAGSNLGRITTAYAHSVSSLPCCNWALWTDTAFP